MSKDSTRKATKVVGTETYINRSTGEIEEMQVISIEERDANFAKIWLVHAIEALELLGSKKLQVVLHILQERNIENQYIGTQREIAETLKISTATVSETIKVLVQSDFMKMEQQGVYRINPNVIYQGGKTSRMNVLYKYHNIPAYKENPEAELEGQLNVGDFDKKNLQAHANELEDEAIKENFL